MRLQSVFLIVLSLFAISCSQSRKVQRTPPPPAESISAKGPAAEAYHRSAIKTGAERTRQYFGDLEGLRIGVVANQTSRIGSTHLVDSLLGAGLQVVKVFSPEHGFRGQAEAGELVSSDVDSKTGLPLVSLYGDHRKPRTEDLAGIDLVLFDLQDVGARFYTYISTLTLVMEACAENNLPLLVLDRPNPNGFYVDGPLLEPGFTSFVGMHAVPVVHGMTMAEYARMVNGEFWLKDSLVCRLRWVENSGYNHRRFYELPVRPSPNLPDMSSVYLYPSLCFFEGTNVSVGRGTDYPFTVIGYPGFGEGNFVFTPESRAGASVNPLYKGIECRGLKLADSAAAIRQTPGIRLHWLIRMYQSYPEKEQFFNSFFNKLAGNDTLKDQILSGCSEEEIKASWQEGLDKFLKIRKKYLLYHDF
jgi:uncharacterized protein YbbC (DUF1343 family)